METLKNNIRVVSFQAPAVLDEDNSPIASAIIDTRELASEAGSPNFDTALIIADVGAFGANLDDVKVKIEESDVANFGSGVSTVRGGDEQTRLAAGRMVFQIERSKRYLRATVTMTASGAADTAPMSIIGILGNWATPFPIV